MSEEDELKNTGEINPDTLEAVFAEEILAEEDDEETPIKSFTEEVDDLDADEMDVAFQANNEGYW